MLRNPRLQKLRNKLERTTRFYQQRACSIELNPGDDYFPGLVYDPKNHDVDKLSVLPQRESPGKIWGWSGRKEYRSWSAEQNYLNKVNVDKFVGHSIDKIYSKYKHRLPQHWNTYSRFHRVLGLTRAIWVDNETLLDVERPTYNMVTRGRYHWRWERFYVDVEDGIIKKLKSRPRPKQLSWVDRMTKAAEQKKQEKRRKRERERQQEADAEAKIFKMRLLDAARRKNEREQNLLKILRHGFDPLTSFRNVPNDIDIKGLHTF
jgi:hypothetical protein